MVHYEEIIDGLPMLRSVGSDRHELLCRRLHEGVAGCLGLGGAARLLGVRDAVEVGSETVLRPDLAVVMEANGKLWLAVEVIQSGDHQADTVLKKGLYEDLRVPRLWMVDPRYDNVEVYHASPYGLMLKGILAAGETLSDPLLGGFSLSVRDLFSA
jgi:hypothetical protein